MSSFLLQAFQYSLGLAILLALAIYPMTLLAILGSSLRRAAVPQRQAMNKLAVIKLAERDRLGSNQRASNQLGSNHPI